MRARKNRTGGVEVLIAEDSATQREQLERLLLQRGYSVATASNGKEALAAARRHKPALIITDVLMPELDGYGLCKAIKSDEKLMNVPVMLVTNLSDPQDVIRGLECGADNFIRKPYEGDHLLSRIDYLLMNIELRKSQKMQMGVEINLGGRKHFITSERQQMLDLLVSTYEQAVRINNELEQRERDLAHSNQVLNGLYRISEGLNRAASEQEVAELVLERALELPGIQAGWISLREGEAGFRLAAARNLPPALALPGAMEGDCACRRRLLSGDLDSVTNIVECQRLSKAKGDTRGLRYHASVPLWLGDRTLGVMNLVGPEKGLFNDDELRILHGIGNQVAVALARARLHEHLERLVEERTAKLEAEIAERRRIEREQAKLAAIIEATPDFVATGDLEGRVLYMNQAGLRMLGHEPGQDVSELRVGTGQPEWALKRVLETGIPHAMKHGTWSGETTFVQRDGREIPTSQVIIAHKGASGSVEFLSTIARDITASKEAERRIRDQLEHLGLLDRITRAIGGREDLKSIFQVVVGTLEESLQLDFACVCLHDEPAHAFTVACLGAKSGALAQDLAMHERASIDIDGNCLSRCAQGQLVYEPDVRQVAFPFAQRLAHNGLGSIVLAPLRSESRVFGVLIAARRAAHGFSSIECEFLRQLSEHVALAANQLQLYGALQHAYDDLRQTQQVAMQQERLRALGQMASGIAHDINNALSPVSLYAESLLDTERDLSERARGHLETIQRAVEDVAQTVARMREFYRQREPQLALTPVQMNSMIQQVFDLTRARWSDMPQNRGIVVETLTELAPELPKIMGVESEIREALINLVFNAVDAMPAGGTLTLRTRVAGADPQRPTVVVEVADTGVGMDEGTRQRCLEPFFTTKGERGTGLGLAMVFGVVQRHSAELEIDSAPGAGTTVRLAFAVPPAIPLEPEPEKALEVPTGLHLLLIDDDPTILKSLRDALESDGQVVVTANGGEAGISALRTALDRGERFAAVITDLGMPYVDGRRVATAVKEASLATPVILLTGWGRRLLDDGEIPPHVDRVLAKPPKLRELREALAQLCRPEAD
jgi:PAS domain S-box-containing protein